MYTPPYNAPDGIISDCSDYDWLVKVPVGGYQMYQPGDVHQASGKNKKTLT